MQDVQDDAGGAALSQIPIMFLAENAMQPSISISCFTTKRALRVFTFMAGEGAGSGAGRLVVEEEERKQDGVYDIAVQAKRLFRLVRAGVTVGGAEAMTVSPNLRSAD